MGRVAPRQACGIDAGIEKAFLILMINQIQLNGGRFDRLGVQSNKHRGSTWYPEQ